MSNAKLVSQFVPPPTGGLNLISDPANFKPDEARQLDNYYIYDWGARERGAEVVVALPDSGRCFSMFSFTSLAKRGTIIGSSGSHIYLYELNGNFTTLYSSGYFNEAFAQNRHIFFPLVGSTSCGRYKLDDDTWSNTSFTLPGSQLFYGGCAFKNRAYFWTGLTGTAYYGGVDAITGLCTAFDFSPVFQRSTRIVFATSWSYNQGQTNDDLFVVCGETGEILIYSGDWPASPNWQLVTRVEIPAPLTIFLQGDQPSTHIVKIGQDILINTSRGLLNLSDIVAGQKDPTAGYFAVSRKLGSVLKGAPGDKSILNPFAYFAGGTSGQDAYILNYERGAWSKFPNMGGGGAIDSIACSTQPIGHTDTFDPYILFGRATGGFVILNESENAQSSPSVTYTWATPYQDFKNSSVVKRATQARLIGRDLNSHSFNHSLTMRADFDDSTVLQADAHSKTMTNTNYTIQDYIPVANAKWLSYVWSKTGNISALNEVSGFLATAETGGSW